MVEVWQRSRLLDCAAHCASSSRGKMVKKVDLQTFISGCTAQNFYEKVTESCCWEQRVQNRALPEAA